MDSLLVAVVLSIVEGLTEFLPISSTGHLILAGDMLGFTGPKAETFEIIIQLGAILAVVALYWRKFLGLLNIRQEQGFAGLRGIWLLILTTLPACAAGLLLHSLIKNHLFTPLMVACSLLAGSIAMILTEKLKPRPACFSIDKLTPKMALGIGCCQCLALWPGFSRSAATIMGGMFLGASRQLAAEYSFIAAVPVMFAATGYDLLKNYSLLTGENTVFFAVGVIGAFVSALIAVKIFIGLLSRVTLIPFAIYRLALVPCILYYVYHAAR